MVTSFFICLVAIDVIILGAIIVLSKKQAHTGQSLLELTEERQYINEMSKSIKEELFSVQAECKDILKRLTHTAAEAEQEVRSGQENIIKDMSAAVGQLTTQFEDPLKELARQKAGLEAVFRRVEKEKQLLLKALDRAEVLSKLFDHKASYDDVMKEIQNKKIKDARQLLAQGFRPDKVAEELGMNRSEIELLSNFT